MKCRATPYTTITCLFHPLTSTTTQWKQNCMLIPLPPFLLFSYQNSQSKSLKVADLKEICARANLTTTTRSTKADLITKILASQAAIDAYNSKYHQPGSTAPPPKSAPLPNNDYIVRDRSFKSRVVLYLSTPFKLAPTEECAIIPLLHLFSLISSSGLIGRWKIPQPLFPHRQNLPNQAPRISPRLHLYESVLLPHLDLVDLH
jgi:hypothetical protein